ncbi:MAG: hypothetical protein IJO32_03345 [Bacilli bacterium]|nr:hypothetical protein [Bacilli bacterium]
MMNELNNFLQNEKINNQLYDKVLNDNKFDLFTQKIAVEQYSELINKIYWLSMTLYRISFLPYFESISSNSDNCLSKENIVIFYPFSIFANELCRILKNDFVYSSLLSTIARQMIEQICVVKEINYEKIPSKKIVEAMIESHNMHIGSKSLEIDGLNMNNEGLLKVFRTGRKYGNLARKYNYYFLYNLYSGDIHHISTIDKIIPKTISSSNTYNKIYLLTLMSLVKDAIFFVNTYSKKLTKEDILVLNNYNFIKITDECRNIQNDKNI